MRATISLCVCMCVVKTITLCECSFICILHSLVWVTLTYTPIMTCIHHPHRRAFLNHLVITGYFLILTPTSFHCWGQFWSCSYQDIFFYSLETNTFVFSWISGRLLSHYPGDKLTVILNLAVEGFPPDLELAYVMIARYREPFSSWIFPPPNTSISSFQYCGALGITF